MTLTATELARLEQIIDTSAVAERVEARLPVGVRPRQLQVRTLLLGMLIVCVDGRPAHLRRVHRALLGLPETEQRRLGILALTRHGAEHRLTYRQIEYTFARVVCALAKDQPDGAPSDALSEVIDGLLEASIQVCGPPASDSLAVDWTALEAWARPPRKDHPDDCVDREAAWGHRTVTHPGETDTFYGYYLQALTCVREESAPAVPELVRRIHLASCRHDPPAQIIPILQRMRRDGIKLGDLLGDSGYAYRQPDTFALPARLLGARLVIDLHPNDRGPKTTHHGAIASNGNLYCPATPQTLLQLGPLGPGASTQQTETHDERCRELHRHKLTPLTAPDPDGYHRVSCPASSGKVRCPLRPASMTLGYDRPTIHQPPAHPPVCCTQKTITVPPSVNAKTTQKHDYPSPQHRRSYNRRTAAERTFATLTDPATINLTRGWCRLTSLTPITLFATTAIIARNLRCADAHHARQLENHHRATHGLAPKTRTRRRQTLTALTTTGNSP